MRARRSPRPRRSRSRRARWSRRREAQQYTLAGIRVVDYNGVVVATTAEDLGASLVDREEVQRALQGEPLSLLRWRGTEPPTFLESIARGAHVAVVVAQPAVRDG